jgi:hypothetical protein
MHWAIDDHSLPAAWTYLHGDLKPYEICAKLLVWVKHNTYIKPIIAMILKDPALTTPDIVKTMFDHCMNTGAGAENTSDGRGEAEIGGVAGGRDRMHRMCLDCVKTCVAEHVVPWLRREFIHREHSVAMWVTDYRNSDDTDYVGGLHLPDKDCPFGWDCIAQMETLEHGEDLNHLCAPARRDSHESSRVQGPIIRHVCEALQAETWSR